MPSDQDRLSEEAARSIWLRAAQLQAEAERRLEESQRLPATSRTGLARNDGLHPDVVRAAGEEAGISPEFVQIALAEASALGGPSSAMTRQDVLGATLFLGARRHTIEATRTVQGSVDSVSAAVLQVFSGHPCLLQAGEVAELPSWSGRVIVFNVPKYDWSASANPPFVEKAWVIGLRQVHVAVRPLPGDEPTCEVVVAGDLHPGMRRGWRWSAGTSMGATVAGGAVGLGMAASAIAGALLIVPAVVGAALMGGATIGAWTLGYRYYRGAAEGSLKESLHLLPAAVRAVASSRGARELAPGDRALP